MEVGKHRRMAGEGEELVFPFGFSTFLGEVVNKVFFLCPLVTWCPTHSDLDMWVFREDGVDVHPEEKGSILGRVWQGVKDHIKGRRGITVELNLCDRGAILNFSVAEVGGVGKGIHLSVKVGGMKGKGNREGEDAFPHVEGHNSVP